MNALARLAECAACAAAPRRGVPRPCGHEPRPRGTAASPKVGKPTITRSPAEPSGAEHGKDRLSASAPGRAARRLRSSSSARRTTASRGSAAPTQYSGSASAGASAAAAVKFSRPSLRASRSAPAGMRAVQVGVMFRVTGLKGCWDPMLRGRRSKLSSSQESSGMAHSV